MLSVLRADVKGSSDEISLGVESPVGGVPFVGIGRFLATGWWGDSVATLPPSAES